VLFCDRLDRTPGDDWALGLGQGVIYGLSSSEIKLRTNDLLNRLQLNDAKNRLIKTLSLGWKQKLAFSVAILHRPAIVFLDEPTSGVDPVTRRQFWELIYEAAHSGITVFVTTHYMDEAEYCNRVTIMVDGRVEALDTPANLKKQYQVNSINALFLKIARTDN
jgi:ABC-2 type transport system ATP-binding protein